MDHATLLDRLHRLANDALALWPLEHGATATLINLSENATYRVDQPSGKKAVLRVHRPGYHSETAIRAELQWLDALRQAGIITPRALPGRDGERLYLRGVDGLSRPRFAVLFDWIDGREPDENDDLIGPFAQLGEITARLHLHVERWPLPDGFERLHWDFEHMLGDTPNWGDWRAAPAMDAASRTLLQHQQDTIERRLRNYGRGSDRFGLVHADLRLANLLIEDGSTRVIDFDDCGFGWFMYDYATALSFIEDHPQIPELTESWLDGYRRQRPLSDDDVAELPTFLMLRRMTLLAWIGSHGETELAQQQGPEFTRVSCRLAEDYLSRYG